MNASNIHLHWKGETPVHRFRTGVSLHSHTLHSRESLTFIYRAAASAGIVAAAIRRGEQQYRKVHGTELNLARGWWTPPLGPHDAWLTEKNQIEELGLNPLISLTDHDDIEAPVSLQILEECRGIPISFEWTLPYGPAFFHLGVHNLPPAIARRWFDDLNDYTRTPRPLLLPEILSSLAAIPGALVVFNHPLWDEAVIGQARHTQLAEEFVRLYSTCIHAFEMNGFRPWRENQAVIAFASASNKPVISGGDRHGTEPNANLNLTNTATFAEFADEVRAGWSDVLIMPQYRERHALRIVHNLIDIMRTHERHANGWRLWSDRVFYQCDGGDARSLTELFGGRIPRDLNIFLGLVQLVARPRVRRFLSGAFSTGEGVAL